jgi:predicted ribosome quality control (RQC) complex YloA/Tae2 family protein
MKELSSMDLYFLAKEFQPLLNSKIEKAFQDDSFILQTHSASMGKRYVRIILPSLIYFSQVKSEIEESGKFAISIRKHIAGARIREIRQLEFERILQFRLETKEKKLNLFIELFRPGNIILTDESLKIIMAQTYKGFGSRLIRPGGQYEYPKKDYNLLDLSEIKLKELLERSDKSSIVITLATELGMGGIYSEYLCEKAGIDKKAQKIKDSEIKKLHVQIAKLLAIEPKGYLIKEGEKISPIELEGSERFDTFNEVLDNIYTQKAEEGKNKEEESKTEKKRKQVESIIKQQEMMILGLQKAIDENQKKGELIYEKYTEIEAILKELNKAKEKYSWHEIKEKLKGHGLIKDLNEKDKTIVIDL